MSTEDDLKILFDTLSQGIFYQAADGTLVDVNESALKMLGVSRDEFMGKTSHDPGWNIVTEDGSPLLPEMHPSMIALKTGTAVKDFILGVYHPATHAYAWLIVNALPQFKDGESSPYRVLVTLYDITDRKLAEKKLKDEALERQQSEMELRRIEWLLTSRRANKEPEYVPPYGDLVRMNSGGLIHSSVGKNMLTDIVEDYLDLLDTSAAVYEINGDYALGIFSSGWCRYMDAASRRLCGTDDNREALNCGKWLCHESCWKNASKTAIETGQPAGIECEGGIHLYAAPIRAGEEIIGAINFGYGDPPADELKLQELATTHAVNYEELRTYAANYESRPPFIIDLAKKRLIASARLIGEIVERKKAEETLLQRESLLNKIFDVLPVGLWLADKNGTLTRSNAKGREIWGAEPLVGQENYGIFKARSLLTGKELAPEDWALAHTIQDGVTVLDEILEIEAFDGKKKIILNYTAPILDRTGKVDGAIIVNLDITDRKRAEDALAHSEKEFRQLAESMPQIVWVCQPDGNNTYFNKHWVSYTGLTLEESYGAGWNKPFHPDDRQRAWDAWQNAVNYNDTYLLECRLRRHDGEYFWWLIRGIPITNEKGEIVKWFGTCTDIHEMKLNTSKIQDQLNELRRWNEAMLNREERVLDLKREVNTLLSATGKPVRYPSVDEEPRDAEKY